MGIHEHSLQPQPRREGPRGPGQPAGGDGARWWNVLPRGVLFEILEEAVRGSLDRLGMVVTADEDELARFTHYTAEIFFDEARKRARRVKRVTRKGYLQEIERSRASAVNERNAALEELSSIQQKTEELRELLSKRHEFSSEDEERMDAELAAEVRRLGRREVGRPDAWTLDGRDVKKLLAWVRAQRARALGEAVADYRIETDVLQRRVDKVNERLQQAEAKLRELADRLEVDPGMASVFRSVQGLAPGTAMREVKGEMLRVIFEANLAILGRRSATG